MKPLLPAAIPEAEIARVALDLVAAWSRGDAEVLSALNANTAEEAAEAAQRMARELAGAAFFRNDTYQVTVTREAMPLGEMVHLSIKRIDRQPIHDWRDLQAIKSELLGEEVEAVELYPAESRRVDTANQYHLWCMPNAEDRFPFGFFQRCVTERSLAGSVQRPL